MPRNFTLKIKREADFEKLSKARDLLELAGIVGSPFATFLSGLLAEVCHKGAPDPIDVKKLLKTYVADFADDMRTIRKFNQDYPNWVRAELRKEEMGFDPIELVSETLTHTSGKILVEIIPKEKNKLNEAPRSANQDAPSALSRTPTSIAGYHGPTMNGGGSGRPLVS